MCMHATVLSFGVLKVESGHWIMFGKIWIMSYSGSYSLGYDVHMYKQNLDTYKT